MLAPIFRAEGSFGLESECVGMPRIIGKIVPSLRAMVDGVKGAMTTSDSITAWPRRSVRLPIIFTRERESDAPAEAVRPQAVPNTKATKASQKVPLLKPESAHSIARPGALNPFADNSVGPNKLHGADAATMGMSISTIAVPAEAPESIQKRRDENGEKVPRVLGQAIGRGHDGQEDGDDERGQSLQPMAHRSCGRGRIRDK
jgi:hypothetical protein